MNFLFLPYSYTKLLDTFGSGKLGLRAAAGQPNPAWRVQ